MDTDLSGKTAAIQAWLKAPWPAESLEAQHKFGAMSARLYPFLGREVRVPGGKGMLVQVFDRRVTVVFPNNPIAGFYPPWEVFPH